MRGVIDSLRINGFLDLSLIPGASASDLLPRVHRVVSLLKRWILGTHHGAGSPEHLEGYLDEFTFRFNRRTSRSGASFSIGCYRTPWPWSPPPTKRSSKAFAAPAARTTTY